MLRKNNWQLLVATLIVTAVANLGQAQPRSLDISPIQWPLYVLRAHREFGFTEREANACQEELLNYKRSEKEACYRAWEEIKDFPKTEIKLTLQPWAERRKQTRNEQLQLIRKRMKPAFRKRYDEVLFQCCVYHGDFFLAAELARLELSDEVAQQLQAKFNSQANQTEYKLEIESYRQLVESESLQKEFGKKINLGPPSLAALEIGDGAGVVHAAMMFPYHITYGQLLHSTVIQELMLGSEQLRRLLAIGQKYGIKERNPGYDVRDGALRYGGGPNFDADAEMAKSRQIIKDLNAVLLAGQRERFRQIQAQALVARGQRDLALNLFGIKPYRDHYRNVGIDRVKKAISADYRLMKGRELFGTVCNLSEVDSAMGRPSFEYLDSESVGFGGASGTKRDRKIVRRTGPAFEKLAQQAGAWYADAIQAN